MITKIFKRKDFKIQCLVVILLSLVILKETDGTIDIGQFVIVVITSVVTTFILYLLRDGGGYYDD